jgi:glutamate/tyrosine decarboxylase-like PLP-dependent enzyme
VRLVRSIQGISWLEAAGAIHTENLVLRLIAERAGLPDTAGGCFVSGGSVARFAFLHPHTSMDLVRQILDRMD